jgi:hypothetical protein
MHTVDVQPEDQDAYDLAHREAKAAMPDLWPVLQHREPEQVVLLFLVVKELDSPGEVLDRRVRAVTRDYVLQKDP